MDVRHDVVQHAVHLLACPRDAFRVLRHLQARGSHAAGVHGFARSEQLAGCDELLDSLCRAAHVRHFCHAERLLGQYPVGILAIQLVLGSAGQVDVSLLLPGLLAGEEGGAVEVLGVGLAHVVARGAQLQQVVNFLCVESGGVVDVAVGTADGNHLGTQLGGLLGSTPGHVAEARECHRLTLDVEAVLGEHLVDEVECAIARGFRPKDRAAPFAPLARQHALIQAGEALSDAIDKVDGFIKKLPAVIRVGEETGQLDKMLVSIANDLDFKSAQALARLVKYIEPVTIVIMAVVVGFVMIGVITPIYQSYAAIGAG